MVGNNSIKLGKKLSNCPPIIELESLVSKYSDVFEDMLGTIKGTHAKLEVKTDAKPKFF